MEEKNYEIYRSEKTQNEFFSTWDSENLKVLNQELRDYIYGKYLLKQKVFNRDSFECQNSECKHKNSLLTIHHFKFKKNLKDKDGNFIKNPDTERNCVTLCRACHKNLHRGKLAIVYKDDEHLPPHIRGSTQQIHKDESIDWKKVKKDTKKIRTELKFKLDNSISNLPKGKKIWYSITWEQLCLLMKFLESNYIDSDDD